MTLKHSNYELKAMFDLLAAPQPDPLHGVMNRYTQDPRSDKIDLGVGVYRDRSGHSPIMKAVSKAAIELLSVETTKAYLPLRGDESFLAHMRKLALGAADERISEIQSAGGTGAIFLALSVAATAYPDLTVYIGAPTWPSHISICKHLKLKHKMVNYFDQASQRLLPDAMLDAVNAARTGDILVLQGACHNPSGADLSSSEFEALLGACEQRGVIPLFDTAYYGLGADIAGDLEPIRAAMRRLPNAMLAISCSKMFSMYRERTGALFFSAPNASAAGNAVAHAETVARNCYSMPPSHGAAVVARVLANDNLRRSWEQEAAEMRARLAETRANLMQYGQSVEALQGVSGQRGIFSLLPITPQIVENLAVEHAIYMPQSGRINIAGFKAGDEERFTSALQSALGHAS